VEKLLGTGTFCIPLAPAIAIGKAFSFMCAALLLGRGFMLHRQNRLIVKYTYDYFKNLQDNTFLIL
jgi:hypothetical protein